MQPKPHPPLLTTHGRTNDPTHATHNPRLDPTGVRHSPSGWRSPRHRGPHNAPADARSTARTRASGGGPSTMAAVAIRGAV
jgi:hypothetical protein